MEKRDLPWERFYDLPSQELGELIRMPKMGKTLYTIIHQFPRYRSDLPINSQWLHAAWCNDGQALLHQP